LELLSSNPGSLNFGPEDGIPEFLGPLKKEGIVAIALSPFFTAENFSGFLAQGFRDAEIPARHDPSYRQRIAEQLSMALSNAKLVEDLQSLSKGTLRALARAVDTKSPWTAGHSERVAKLAVQIGADMGLAPHEIKKLEQAGFLHDIGKIGVSNLILDKPGKLSDEEYNLIKQHPALGVRILEPLNIFADILPAILHHHEHFDGSGYPHGLKGFEIPLGARILVVADVYDALASDRPYRSGWDNSRIFELLERESGHHFDPEIISVFFKIKTAEKKTSQTSCFPVAKVG
jgi:putative nucleotidyltransferase with HDIG domain